MFRPTSPRSPQNRRELPVQNQADIGVPVPPQPQPQPPALATPLRQNNTERLRSAISRSAASSPRNKNRAIDFRSTISIDRTALLVEIVKTSQEQYTSLLPYLSSATSPIQQQFDRLFEKVSQQFSSESNQTSLEQIKKNGRIANYTSRVPTNEKRKLLLAMNDFFGMVASLPPAKQSHALGAALSMPNGDLNCVDGMVERLDFIKNAITSSNGLIAHSCAEAERKLIWRDRAVVDVHAAHRNHLVIQAQLEAGQAPKFQALVASEIERFLEKDVRLFLDDLNKIIDGPGDLATVSEAIKQCQEKHLTTLQWFFPPKAELDNAETAAPTAQLHQHADYFELDEDCTRYAKIKTENILRDAIKVALPVLATGSRLSILHNNPAYSGQLAPLLFPEYLAAQPNLQPDAFFKDVLPQKIIPKMIAKGESISLLVKQKVISIESVFAKIDGHPSIVEQMIEKDADHSTIEMLYLHADQLEDQSQVGQLKNARSVSWLEPATEEMRSLDITDSETLSGYFTKVKSAHDAAHTSQFKKHITRQVGHALMENFNALPDQQKSQLIKAISTPKMQDVMSVELAQYCAQRLVEGIEPAQTRLETKIHSQIVDYVKLLLERQHDVSLSPPLLALMLTLTASMESLHAATLSSGVRGLLKGELLPHQNPQMKAYKLLKQQLQRRMADPAQALALINVLWRDGQIDRLSAGSRTITAEHAKTIAINGIGKTAMLGSVWLIPTLIGESWTSYQKFKRDGGPLTSIRHAACRLTLFSLQSIRQTAAATSPTAALTQQKIVDAWQPVLRQLENNPVHASVAFPASDSLHSDATQETSPPALDLAKYEQVMILGSYLEEFNSDNFSLVSADAIDTSKTQTLDRIDPERLHALMPRLLECSAVAYLEAAKYLLTSEKTAHTLTPARVRRFTENMHAFNPATYEFYSNQSILNSDHLDERYARQIRMECDSDSIRAALAQLTV